MSRIRVLLLMIAVMAAVVTGCGDNNDPPDSGTGNNLLVGLSAVQWSFVDGNERYAGINVAPGPGGAGDAPQMAAYSNRLYAIWTENNTAVRVKAYNGNDAAPSWTYVDNGPDGINRVAGSVVLSPQLSVFNSKLYAAWREADQVRIAVYNGNDIAPVWTFVDGDQPDIGINGSPASSPSLAISGSMLYSTWTETTVRVARYNGDDASPSWTFIDGGGFAVPSEAGGSRLVDFNAKLYLASQYNGGVSVRVFNGNVGSPAWNSVTGTLPAIQRYSPPSILSPMSISAASLNGKLYLAWEEYVWVDRGSTGQWLYEMLVAVYNGNDNAPDWSFVTGDALHGINKDPLQTADSPPQLAVYGSNLIATWAEHLPDVGYSQIRVAAYNGNDTAPAWTFIDRGSYGVNFDPVDNAYSPQVIAFNSKLYLTWREDYLGSHIRIAAGQ